MNQNYGKLILLCSMFIICLSCSKKDQEIIVGQENVQLNIFSIELSPNPFQSLIGMKLIQGSAGAYYVKIYSNLGVPVDEFHFNFYFPNQVQTINLAHLNLGHYIMQVSHEGVQVPYKIVKN